MKKNNLLVIVPTYNEAENIYSFINLILKKDLDLLIIDDNSPDNTGKIVNELIKSFPNLYKIDRTKKLGLGTAYKEGFKWGINNDYSHIVTMDADFSHRFDDLDNLIAELNTADLILGSRYVLSGGSEGWDWKRKLLSLFANKVSKAIIGTKLNDLTTGFRIYNTSALKTTKFDNVSTDGYAFQIEMVYLFLDNRKLIKEVPIIFEERRLGKSKMSNRIIFEALILLFRFLIIRFKNFLFSANNL
tara:strand:- start:1112 stop:1846 length:735 start_codon:yes stop_codon:yes gene_type:complete